MCTGNFFEHSSVVGNNKPRPPAGTRCAGPCVHETGRWGSSYCFTEDGNWGAECISCPGTQQFILSLLDSVVIFKEQYLQNK